MKYDFEKLCRICGNFDSQLIPIFTGDGLEHNLPGKIEKHLSPIDIQRCDQLPQQVCYQCVSSLVIWSDLYELSIKVDKNFKNELEKREKKKAAEAQKKAEILSISPPNDGLMDETEIIDDKENDEALHFGRISQLDDDITAKIFEEIDDFDSFLNHSSASSISTDSNVEDVEVVIEENLDHNDLITECNVESLNSGNVESLNSCNVESLNSCNVDLSNPCDVESPNSVPQNENPPSTNAPISESTEPTPDLTTKSRKRRFRKNPLRSRVCYICGKTFKGPDTMRLHIKTVHSGERPHVCPTCNTAFKRRDHLLCHVKYKHGNLAYPKRPRGGESQKRLCVHCGKLLSSSQLLKEHINACHTGQQPYRCEKCNLSFSRHSTLYHHAVVRNHKISSFSKSCDICGLDFQSEMFYLRHMWKHPENVFCEACKIEFNNNDDLKKHVDSVHQEVKPLQCDTCGKKFGTKAGLKLHVRVHTGEKPYECQYCSWKFHKKGQLVVHIYRHTGERPYVCSVCGRGFKQRGDMRKHKAGHLKQMKKDLPT